MTQQTIDRIVQEFFPKSEKGDWEKAATLETQKKNPLESLAWHGKDNILFLPYYDAYDAAHVESPATFQDHHSARKANSRTWINLPAVFSSDEQTSNARALEHLMSGADGVMFDIRESSGADATKLLAEIQLPHCFTAFRLGPDPNFPAVISDYFKHMAVSAAVSGALFWESIPKKGDWSMLLQKYPNFLSLGIIVSPSSPAQEIADSLTNGVALLDTMCRSYPLESVFRSICFSLPADAPFFETIARYRALRMLWYQVALAYGLNDYNAGDLHLHACSRAVPDRAYDPHENMLKGTFSAMASILGGCNSLTVELHPDQPSLSRWGRNVSNILREESFFDAVQNPVAGAYALDCITESISKRAWSLFQQNARSL
jgi:methylmalonyl-CoA mutase